MHTLPTSFSQLSSLVPLLPSFSLPRRRHRSLFPFPCRLLPRCSSPRCREDTKTCGCSWASLVWCAVPSTVSWIGACMVGATTNATCPDSFSKLILDPPRRHGTRPKWHGGSRFSIGNVRFWKSTARLRLVLVTFHYSCRFRHPVSIR